MNRFINFKKILFSLFLLSLSFSPVFLMEDETTGSEPMKQIEEQSIEQKMEQELGSKWQEIIDKIIFDSLCNSSALKNVSPNSSNWMTLYLSQKEKIDKGIMQLNLNIYNEHTISDEMLNCITKRFPNLLELNFRSSNKVTNKALQYIDKNCHRLQILKFSCCEQINDEGLLFSDSSYNNLQSLTFSWCRNVSNNALESFKQSHPNLKTAEAIFDFYS